MERAREPAGDPTPLALFARGFVGLLPLWAGAIPIGIAYGVAGRGAGLGFGETQLMSLIVFSAAAQVSTLSLLAAGAPAVVIVATALALNAQLLLIGLAVGREACLSWAGRLATACLLTDGAYGVALGMGRLRLPVLLGAGASMYAAWNLGTAIGAAAGSALPDLRRLGADMVVPLTFLAVLVPLVRTRAAALAALVAGATALLLAWLAPGAAVLGAGLVGSAAGAWWAHRGRPGAAAEGGAR